MGYKMKKISRKFTCSMLVILMVIKYFLYTTSVPNIVMTIFGLVLTFFHYQIFKYLISDIKVRFGKFILFSVIFTNIFTTIINASAYFSDLASVSITFMVVVILSKLFFTFSCFIILNECFERNKKKYLPVSIGYLFLSLLSFIEILTHIEAVVELIIMLYYCSISKQGKKDDKITNTQK